MNEDEKLSAFLDQELDRAAQPQVDALSREPAAAAQLQRLRANDELIRAAFDAPMHEGLPDRFARVIDAGLADHRTARAPITPNNDNQPRWWQLGGAVAASLAVGLLLGTQWLSPAGEATTSVALGTALSTTPSLRTVSLASGERLTPQMTFARAGGGYCRQFRLAAAGRDQAGLACGTKGHWALEAMMPATAAASAKEGYVTAEGAAPSGLDAVIDGLRAGDPLAGAAENTLMANGWQ